VTAQSSVRRSSAQCQEDATWRPVPGYEGRYEVSDQGDVRSLRRPGVRGGVLSSWDVRGYRFIWLCANGDKKAIGIHRLVLRAHVGPETPGDQARHLNGVRHDNRLSNLAWGTASQNQRDTMTYDGWSVRRRTHCKYGHEFTEANTQWRTAYNGQRHRKCRTCRLAEKQRYRERRRAA